MDDAHFQEFLKTVKPMGDRVLVEAEEEKTETSFGLVLPDSASKDRPQKGRVLAVGEGKRGKNGERIPMTVKVGDMVLYSKYGPTEVKVAGREVLFLEEASVLAVIGE
ncbi:co-chaperone GroES [Candidatus Peregrinibacteria bacterium CG_4_9_14_0_2_um_filter_53_11]|nr:MAG: co-chaperone GroES [Candidatus Peregrinibacteria bacterium CG_4_9_14_0_2_um_filter_53_11]